MGSQCESDSLILNLNYGLTSRRRRHRMVTSIIPLTLALRLPPVSPSLSHYLNRSRLYLDVLRDSLPAKCGAAEDFECSHQFEWKQSRCIPIDFLARGFDGFNSHLTQRMMLWIGCSGVLRRPGAGSLGVSHWFWPRHQPVLTADKLIVGRIQVKKALSKRVHFVGWTISQDSVGVADHIFFFR